MGSSSVRFLQSIDTSFAEPDFDLFQPKNLPDNVVSIDLSAILLVIYVIGFSILFIRLLYSNFRVIKLARNAETVFFDSYRIVRVESIAPFSFFNVIFLPKTDVSPLIVEHEIAHVKQYHWIDLMLIEIISTLLWFNPFLVLYKRALRLQHEYLADSSVLMYDNCLESYLRHMLMQVKMISTGGLVSQFYCKTIKKRILMITKNKTSVKYLGVYFLTLPLLALLLLSFTNRVDKSGLIPKMSVVSIDSENTPSLYPVDIKKAKLSSGYGEWTNPLTKKKGFHYGIDIAAKEGTEIYSTANGVVVEATLDTKQQKGNYIVIKHNDMYSTFYSHLKSISVKVGDFVKSGQVIGYVGNTGVSTGPHLHYEVHKNGERVNPKDYLPK
ncbi:MAG: peptidoglycan DD-metalloendopeptidase family protein [Bacteroidales bacterium]